MQLTMDRASACPSIASGDLMVLDDQKKNTIQCRDVLAAAGVENKAQCCSSHSLALAHFKSVVISMRVCFNESGEVILTSGCQCDICMHSLFGEMLTFMPMDFTQAL